MIAIASPQPVSKALRIGRIGPVAVAVLAVLLAACGGGAAPDDAAASAAIAEPKRAPETQSIAVEVEPVQRRSIAASYTGTAALEALNEAQVVAKTSGVLISLHTEEGERVRAGQLLARIDPERPRLEVQRAETTLRKLEAEFARATELFERKLIAAEAHERLRFDLATQRAAFDLAKLELSYTSIVAPISGVVARRMVKEGNLVPLNSPVFRIVNTDNLEAVLNVPERELGTMKAGLTVALQVDALPGQRIEGRIDRVSPVVDAGTGTFRVTTAFAGSENLRPGMFGRIEVIYDRRADALTVPRSALLEGEGEAAVFAVRDGKAVRTGVRLGHINGTYAEVINGLDEGDRVVTVGKVTLRDGTSVDVVNEPAVDEAAQDELQDEARIAHAGALAVAFE
jgi:membrane fusion protein, multidrug efflux system